MIYSCNNNKSLSKAVEILEKGEVIIYPTDTLYGFGADATNSQAIEKLNFLKNRKDPLSIILSSVEEIDGYGYLENESRTVCNKIFPGPFTILIKSKKTTLSPLVNEKSNLTGIRIPNHIFPIEIVKKLGKPIITTSVNKKEKPPLSKISDMQTVFPGVNIFKDKINHSSKGSTIINLAVNPCKIIRYRDGKL